MQLDFILNRIYINKIVLTSTYFRFDHFTVQDHQIFNKLIGQKKYQETFLSEGEHDASHLF